MNAIFLALAAVASASLAAAQNESALFQARGFEAFAAGAIRSYAAEDSFAGVPACGVLDIKTVRAWTLDEAAALSTPCFEAVSRKYGVSMAVEPGFLASARDDRPARAGLVLKTDIAPGSKAHRDLASSLARREGRILGQPARLLTRGEAAPESVSALQAALKQCITTTVVRDIKSGEDFVKLYGRCLTANRDLKIGEIRPGEGLSVTLETEAAADVEALNGFVVVDTGRGPVRVMVVAHSAR